MVFLPWGSLLVQMQSRGLLIIHNLVMGFYCLMPNYVKAFILALYGTNMFSNTLLPSTLTKPNLMISYAYRREQMDLMLIHRLSRMNSLSLSASALMIWLNRKNTFLNPNISRTMLLFFLCFWIRFNFFLSCNKNNTHFNKKILSYRYASCLSIVPLLLSWVLEVLLLFTFLLFNEVLYFLIILFLFKPFLIIILLRIIVFSRHLVIRFEVFIFIEILLVEFFHCLAFFLLFETFLLWNCGVGFQAFEISVIWVYVWINLNSTYSIFPHHIFRKSVFVPTCSNLLVIGIFHRIIFFLILLSQWPQVIQLIGNWSILSWIHWAVVPQWFAGHRYDWLVWLEIGFYDIVSYIVTLF